MAPARATVAGVLLGAALGLWAPLEGLAIWLEVRSAEAAALLSPPVPWFDAPAALLTLGLTGWAVAALVRRRAEALPYRLVPMAGVVVLFAKLFVLPDVALPAVARQPDVLVDEALLRMEDAAPDLADPAGVLPDDPAIWGTLLGELGRPLYLHHGKIVPAWTVRVRVGCDGPVTERGTDGPGTLHVCLAPDRKTGWATGVGLPTRAGTPDFLRDPGGQVRVARLGSSPPPDSEYDGEQVGGDAAPLPAP